MKRIAILMLFLAFTSLFMGCSGIYRTITYHSKSEGWTEIRDSEGWYRGNLHANHGDSLLLTIDGVRPYPVIIGPIFLPIVFPTSLIFWAEPDREMTIDCVFTLHQPYVVKPSDIRFVDKKGQIMYPAKIERLDVERREVVGELDSTQLANGINTEKALWLRWYFMDKTAMAKGVEVQIGAHAIVGSSMQPPIIRFKRKSRYQYVPLIVI